MDRTLTGIFIPLVTPFTPAGTVALDALERLAHEVLDGGAAGLVALGTTGEPATLRPAERRAVIEVCARVCGQRGVPLVVGAGSNDTAASVEALAALGEWPAISAALVPVPYYTRPGAAGVLAHLARLAEHSPVPLVVYHIPYRTGQRLDAGTLLCLARLPNVTGIKYATGGLDGDTLALLAEVPPGFAVLAGDDAVASPLLALGAAGGILASAHLCTARFADLDRAWRDGDVARARPLGLRLAALSATLFAEPNPAVIKSVLHAQSRIPDPGVRLPLLPASEAATAAALATVTALEPVPAGTG